MYSCLAILFTFTDEFSLKVVSNLFKMDSNFSKSFQFFKVVNLLQSQGPVTGPLHTLVQALVVLFLFLKHGFFQISSKIQACQESVSDPSDLMHSLKVDLYSFNQLLKYFIFFRNFQFCWCAMTPAHISRTPCRDTRWKVNWLTEKSAGASRSQVRTLRR